MDAWRKRRKEKKKFETVPRKTSSIVGLLSPSSPGVGGDELFWGEFALGGSAETLLGGRYPSLLRLCDSEYDCGVSVPASSWSLKTSYRASKSASAYAGAVEDLYHLPVQEK